MADHRKSTAESFVTYPKAVEGPKLPFRMPDPSNLILRRTPLIFAGWFVSKVGFIQKLIYNDSGFSGLRELDLANARERWDFVVWRLTSSQPTVIPLASQHGSQYIPNLDPSSFQDLPKDAPGRYHTVAHYHSKYVSGELTPLAVCQSLLPLIRRDISSPSPHSVSFVAINVDSILVAAKESTARYAAGRPLGLIDGVPTAIKTLQLWPDTEAQVGESQMTSSSPYPKPLEKLENSGAAIPGKTDMHEYGTDTTGLNPNWGTPRNPHNRNYYPGGSSSGSAYAVASGLIPFAFGADGGRSIRIPAAFCGIYGLKPTHGRVEDTESTITCTGPLAATMMNLEAMYRVLAQPNPSDSICAHFAPPSTTPTSHSKFIGIYKPWFSSSEKSVLDVCQKAVDYYQNKLGYEIVDVEIPYLAEGQKAHASTPLTSTSWLSELNAANKVIFSVVGNQTSALDYRLAQQMRNILMQHLAYLYEKYPNMIIVTPTSPMPGWDIKSEEDLKYGGEDGDGTFRSMEYIWTANFCGNPAISVPVGYVDPVKTAGEGKMPVGLMAMGDWGSEDQLLAWG
ncbi:hypothetical protein CJF32_00003846 [Rutstroemia sp. NJR-2017a WRK4]|nr:hypothetical protein CJF32_00003846 [Rutstroemia sp. NJR-2017a WRK4]